MEELNKYMVSEQNPADYYKDQINWENGFIVGSYWATYNTYKGSDRYTYNDKSGGWKFHIHADNDEDWQKISSVLIPYLKDVDASFKTFTAPEPNAYNPEPRRVFYDKDENQYGKAYTIYPNTLEEFEQFAQEIYYILENNNLNTHQGFIHGDNQIGDHGRIFYRNEWTSPTNPNYRANADEELPIYKAEGIEDPFLNVLGYPNDNTNAEKAAGTHGPRKLVENRLAKLKEAEGRIAQEQAQKEETTQTQLDAMQAQNQNNKNDEMLNSDNYWNQFDYDDQLWDQFNADQQGWEEINSDEQEWEEIETENQHWAEIDAKRNEIAQKNRREEAFLPSDDNGRHYNKADLEKILSTFNTLRQNQDKNKTAFNSLNAYSRQDLKDYNNGELTISPDAVDIMKEFINIFGTDSNGKLNEVGQEALNNIEQQKNVMWAYERMQDIDFVHITPNDYPVFYNEEKLKEEIRTEYQSKNRYTDEEIEELVQKELEHLARHFESMQKPMVGLWTSPNNDSGVPDWEAFAEREQILERYKNPKEHWHIVPNEDCKIFVVKHDLSNIHNYVKDKLPPRKDGIKELSIDYDKLKKDYDAVFIPLKACSQTVEIDGKYFTGFYAMDVDSCVFLKEKYTIMGDKEYREYRRNKLLEKQKAANEAVLNTVNKPEPQVAENRLSKATKLDEVIQQQTEQKTNEVVSNKETNINKEQKSLKTPRKQTVKKATVKTETPLKQQKLNEAIKFAGNKKAKANASIDTIIEHYEALKQKDIPANKRRAVKKEMEQLQSLAQTRMNEAIMNISRLKIAKKAPSTEQVTELNKLIASFDDKTVGAYMPSIRKLSALLKEFQIENKETEKKVQPSLPNSTSKEPETPVIKPKENTAVQTAKVELATPTEEKEIQNKKQAPKKSLWKKIKDGIKNLPKWVKNTAIGIVTVAAVAFGLQKCSSDDKKDAPQDKRLKTEIKTQPYKEETPTKQEKILAIHADEIEKAYYDSAIKMQIGAKKRNILYNIIEKRVNEGKLDIGNFSVERTAHAMVMAQKIQPNNKINQIFNKVIVDKEITKAENARIKKFVHSAGEYGEGVKGNGSYSQFEQASEQQKLEHIRVLKEMHDR